MSILPELVEEVLEHAMTAYQETYDPNMISDLLSFSLVASSWTRIAQKHLWKVILLDTNDALLRWAASPAHTRSFAIDSIVIRGAWKDLNMEQLSPAALEKVLAKVKGHSVKELLLAEINSLNLDTLKALEDSEIARLVLQDIVMEGTHIVSPFINYGSLFGLLLPTYQEKPRSVIPGAQDSPATYNFKVGTIDIYNCILTTPFLISLGSTEFNHLDFTGNASDSTARAIAATFKSIGSSLRQLCIAIGLAFHSDILESLIFLKSLEIFDTDLVEDYESTAIVVQEILKASSVALKEIMLRVSHVESEAELMELTSNFLGCMFGFDLTSEEIKEKKRISLFEKFITNEGKVNITLPTSLLPKSSLI